VTHELSDYANGPYGWLMTVGFLGLGLGSLLLVWIVARGHDAGLLSPTTLVLLGVWGVARFLAAFFRDDLPGAVPTVHGRIHNVLGALAFFSVSIAMILASRSFRREPRWSSLSMLSLVLGVLALIATLLFVGGVDNSSPTHPVLGLSERVFYVCAIVWLLLVGIRIARTHT
jgi:predicted membrane channel-forming protein YqfA (hemolysin III family)